MKKNLLLKRLFSVLFLLFISTISWAYDFEVDGIYYYINSDGTSVTVTYKTSSDRSYSGVVTIPMSVTHNSKIYSVTSIGGSAFNGCSGLTSVTIGNGVTSIGNYAFYNCSGLTSINIPDGVTSIGERAFLGCKGLTSITIPESVTSIRSYAFSGCSGLTSIDIPNSVTSIGESAFSGCSGLKTINIPNSVTSIDSWAFSGCSGLTSITIPNSVTSIGYEAFSGCSGLTSVTIPNSVTSIGSSAFSGCSGLISITIPESVTSIGSSAFSGCSGLTSINVAPGNTKYDSRDNCNAIIITTTNTLFIGCKSSVIPESVTSIGDYAFQNCSGLNSITIPESVTSIGQSAFQNCSGLTSIDIPESVTSIGGWAFQYCSGLTSITINSNEILSKTSSSKHLYSIFDWRVKEYIIGNKVTSIGDYAFQNCSGLTSVTIPNSVTSIGSSAFSGCSGLTSIDIPNSVTSIGQYAFYGCSGLNSITIPESVTSIGDYAFQNCSGLTSINVAPGNTKYDSRDNCNAIIITTTNTLFIGCKSSVIPESVTSIGDYAFQNCSGLNSITIPESVTSIGGRAFQNCSGLTSIDIPESVTSIGGWAFQYCSGLTSVTIGNGVTSIGNYAFYNCSGLTSLTIGSGVKTVGQDAFYGINRLSSLTILCQNADSWFKGVTTLKDLMLGNGVESIADEAFSGCSELTTISIGNGIKSIGTKAFANCGNIYDVYCYAIRYPTTSADAFENSYPDYITLHVPDESVDNYKAVAPWNTFKKVVGISSDSGREACEKPVLTYKDGKLEATSETEGAQCVIIISDEDVNTHFNSVNLTATYHISAYATKPNYKNSEIVTATLCWIDQEPETEGLINDVAEVRALPVLIQSEDGVISVNGINSGTEVRVYSVNGTMAGSANATDNSAQIDTNLLPGSIAIVKIGEKSVKIVMK